MSSVLTAAYAQIPGLAAAEKASENARRYRHGAPDLPFNSAEKVFADSVARATELLQAGEDLPEDLADAFIEAERRDASAKARSAMLQQAASTFNRDTDALIAEGSAHAFEYLDGELARLVEESQDDANLVRNIQDGTSALIAGGEEMAAWSRLATTTGWYDEIRSAQASLVSTMAHATETIHNSAIRLEAFLFRDGMDRHPYFTSKRLAAVVRSTRDTDEAAKWVAWLNDCDRPRDTYTENTGQARWWTGGDRIAQLVDIVLHQSPWVPSYDTLLAVWEAAGAAIAPVDTVPGSRALAARAKLYKLTEAHTTFDVTHTPVVVRKMVDDGSGDLTRTTKPVPTEADKAASRFDRKLQRAKARSDAQTRANRDAAEWAAARD